MAYTNHDIEDKARQLLDCGFDDRDDKLLKAVCSAAGAELSARLRRGVESSDIEELFVSAAGVLAISMYIELHGESDKGVESFSAGSLKVKLKNETKYESAAALRKLAENMLASYLECGGFSFTGV